jgi:hypothetical protein
MEYLTMKRFFSIAFCTMIFASPTLAEPTTTTGGGDSITVQSGNTTATVRDTSVRTTLDNGVVVQTSTGPDGRPNGGVGRNSGNNGGNGGNNNNSGNGGNSSTPPAQH